MRVIAISGCTMLRVDGLFGIIVMIAMLIEEIIGFYLIASVGVPSVSSHCSSKQ